MGNEITQLVGDIKNTVDEYVKMIYRSEKVTHLPALPIELNLAEGWTSRLIHCDNIRDSWLCKGKAGTTLPEHFHPDQNKIVTVLEGSIEIKIGEDTHRLTIGESMEVEKGQRHEIFVNEGLDAELMVVYQPPLAKEP